MNFKKFCFTLIFFFVIQTNSHSIEPNVFVQLSIDKTTKILSKNNSKEEKINKLKSLALEIVDIKGIGLYTLGPIRKTLDENQKKKYNELFENYFLESFSNRLVDYSNPDIQLKSSEILNENYTIVDSLLKGNDQRPDIKIAWRIYTKDNTNPLIRDVIIEGLSLARTQKEEFSSILNSNDGDIKILFKTLEEFSKK